MTLIPNWRQAWRFHTVIVAALLAAVNFAVDHSDVLLAAAPPELLPALNRWVPLVLIVLRLIRQPAAAAAPAPADPAPPKESP
jgi:hypothetical protein